MRALAQFLMRAGARSFFSISIAIAISIAISVSIAILDCDFDFVTRIRGALLLSIPAAFDSGRAALDHDHFLGANDYISL